MLVKQQWENDWGDSPYGMPWVQLGQGLSVCCGWALELDPHEWAPILLPTDWVWGSGQTASIVSLFLCKIGKFTLLGRAVMEIKYGHACNKQFFQSVFEEGSRSILTDTESRLCFRIGCHSCGWEREDACYGLTESIKFICQCYLKVRVWGRIIRLDDISGVGLRDGINSFTETWKFKVLSLLCLSK